MNIIFYPRFILLHLGLIFSILLQAKALGFYTCIFWISFDIIMGQNMKMGAVCLHKCRRYQKSTFPLVIHSNIPMKDNNCKLYIGLSFMLDSISCYKSKTPALISSFYCRTKFEKYAAASHLKSVIHFQLTIPGFGITVP